MIRPARVISCALLGLFGALIAQACGGSAGKAESGGTGGMMVDATPDLGDGSQELQPNGEGGAAGASPFNPLCGVNAVSDCVPDDELACGSYEPPGGSGGAPGESTSGGGGGIEAGAAGASGRAGGEGGGAGEGAGAGGTPGIGPSGSSGTASASEGGEGGQSASDGPNVTGSGGADGGDAGQAGGLDSGGGGGGAISAEGGASGEGAGSGGISGGGHAGAVSINEYGCRVATSPGGGIQSQCEPAGTGSDDAPCFSSADCAPGLACTGDSGAGQCRRFCCAGNDECQQGTHCAERPLLGEVARPVVPVCVPAVDCSLTEPFPCPAGVNCSCPAGEACMVVRDDGTTTCIKPGSGTAGEPCPCSSGHICSQATQRCVKLCQTAVMPSECGSGRCQVSVELPAGFGVCVGLAADAAP